jgi:ORF6N domain
MEIPVEKIESMIYSLRGFRMMLDSDLAKLYCIETKVLNQAVRRNMSRFPDDFMIQPDSSELAYLRSQIVTLDKLTHGNFISKYPPLLFTENGVAMLSSVLRSERAVQVNITIMRTFTKLRSFLSMDSSSKEDVGQLKKDTNHLFKIVFERLDNLEDQLAPRLPANRKKIGLKPKD